MIFDSHVHTKFSFDSHMSIEDAIKNAKNRNFGIVITEHYDDVKDDKYLSNELDIESYLKEYEKYRSDDLLIGVEVGLSRARVKENQAFMDAYDFDFRLGSLHTVLNLGIYEQYPLGNDSKITYEMYLDKSIEMVGKNDFDSLGHIDYPSRISKMEDREILLHKHMDQYDTLFKALINKGTLLELNTRRLNDKTAHDSMFDIYTRYKELGGKYVTLGSDAHSQEHIFRNFNIAFEFMDKIGLKAAYFKNRKMIVC